MPPSERLEYTALQSMDAFLKSILWAQFGAAIDMLENAMRACPDQLWSDPSKPPQWITRDVVGFWYVVYHPLFFLDLYLSDSAESFAPPAGFTLDEMDPAGLLPERPYTKDELQSYLDHGRTKCRAAIEALTEKRLASAANTDRANTDQWISPSPSCSSPPCATFSTTPGSSISCSGSKPIPRPGG